MIAPDRFEASPNVNPFPPLGSHVVIHATRSGTSMNPSELEGTVNYFKRKSSQVSAHWVIGRDGEKVRMVDDEMQAWHAGQHNAVAFGIELCQGVESDGFTDVQIDALTSICRGYVADFGVEPVHTLDMQQSGFIGHQETPQGKSVGKSDPGALFDWETFIAKLTEDDDMELAKKERLIAQIVATLKRPDYELAERDPDPNTGEPVIEVLSGVGTDEAIRIRIR